MPKRVYMASYNATQTASSLEKLKAGAAYDIYATDQGMIFSIELPENRDIIVTLPYVKGYSIYVDGVKTDYKSYRDALILIDTAPGHRDVLITYTALGSTTGFIISLISAMTFLISSWIGGKEDKKQDKYIK